MPTDLHHPGFTLAVALLAGIVAQLLARLSRVPAIVVPVLRPASGTQLASEVNMKWRYSTVLCALLGCFVPATALSACYIHAEPEPVVAQADYVPPHVEYYPREYYDGHVVLLVDGRWYFRDRGRWVYYREEPEALRSRRLHGHVAPPARDREAWRRRAPPARR